MAVVGHVTVPTCHVVSLTHASLLASPYVSVVSGGAWWRAGPESASLVAHWRSRVTALDAISPGEHVHTLVARVLPGESLGPCGRHRSVLKRTVVIAAAPTDLLFVRGSLEEFLEAVAKQRANTACASAQDAWHRCHALEKARRDIYREFSGERGPPAMRDTPGDGEATGVPAGAAQTPLALGQQGRVLVGRVLDFGGDAPATSSPGQRPNIGSPSRLRAPAAQTPAESCEISVVSLLQPHTQWQGPVRAANTTSMVPLPQTSPHPDDDITLDDDATHATPQTESDAHGGPGHSLDAAKPGVSVGGTRGTGEQGAAPREGLWGAERAGRKHASLRIPRAPPSTLSSYVSPVRVQGDVDPRPWSAGSRNDDIRGPSVDGSPHMGEVGPVELDSSGQLERHSTQRQSIKMREFQTAPSPPKRPTSTRKSRTLRSPLRARVASAGTTRSVTVADPRQQSIFVAASAGPHTSIPIELQERLSNRAVLGRPLRRSEDSTPLVEPRAPPTEARADKPEASSHFSAARRGASVPVKGGASENPELMGSARATRTSGGADDGAGGSKGSTVQRYPTAPLDPCVMRRPPLPMPATSHAIPTVDGSPTATA